MAESEIGPSVVVSCTTGNTYDVPDSADLASTVAQADADDKAAIEEMNRQSAAAQAPTLPPLIEGGAEE